MLIPHDRGSTRTLTLSSLHFWVIVCLLAVLTFSTTFLYQRHHVIALKSEYLQGINRNLELELAQQPEVLETVAVAPVDDSSVREMEERLRSEYEESIAAITAELNDLYEMEAKARDITGLAPRKAQKYTEPKAGKAGKGGPVGALGGVAYAGMAQPMRPPQIIYGLSNPSADLIVQEIRLRKKSFSDLVADLEVEQDRIERVPSIWPLVRNAGRITSPFGYRRDPFTRRVRHHSGTDISATYGTKVRATAKGVVVESTYERDYGNLVKIDHGNGMQTWYAHLANRYVKKGAVVGREDVVGTLGNTGRSTGPHLHYEVRINNKAVNAEKYLTD